MGCRGHVENGVVVLSKPGALPEGAEVDVSLVGQAAVEAVNEGPTLYERLKHVVGKAKGLPPDAAQNHDHYLYGLPKK